MSATVAKATHLLSIQKTSCLWDRVNHVFFTQRGAAEAYIACMRLYISLRGRGSALRAISAEPELSRCPRP